MSGVSRIQTTLPSGAIPPRPPQSAGPAAPAQNLRPLGDRLVTGVRYGAAAAAPVALVSGAGIGALATLFGGGLGSTLVRGTSLGIAMIGVPIVAAGAASGAAAAALDRGPSAAAAIGGMVGAGTAIVAGALLDLGVHELKPAFLVAGAAMGGVSALVANHAISRQAAKH